MTTRKDNYHYSIDQFCKLNGFSRGFFRELCKSGKAPKVYKIDPTKKKSKIFIPKQSADDWYENNEMYLKEVELG